MKLLIITPIYYGDVSGASVYYQTLVSQFRKKDIQLTIVSEKDKRITQECYYGLFPARSGKDRSRIKDYLAYALQNISYLKIYSLIKKNTPDIVLVHSSFYNHPGIFGLVMRWVIRLPAGPEYILDVRDPLAPEGVSEYFNQYKHIIVCSKNTESHCLGIGVIKEKLTYIPVIQQKIVVEEIPWESVQKKHGLLGVRYIFSAGLIKESKGASKLLDAFQNYVSEKHPEIQLVLVGLIKSTNSGLISKLYSKNVIYLGSLPRLEVLGLMAGAELCVNISPVEGLPRVSLEALALKKPVLLPSNVPEFELYDRKYVADPFEAKSIGKKINDILKDPVKIDYPLENHSPNVVIKQYMNTFGTKKSSTR